MPRESLMLCQSTYCQILVCATISFLVLIWPVEKGTFGNYEDYDYEFDYDFEVNKKEVPDLHAQEPLPKASLLLPQNNLPTGSGLHATTNTTQGDWDRRSSADTPLKTMAIPVDLLTIKGNDSVIVYNRVSKCASTTVRYVFRDLGLLLGYDVASSTLYHERHLSRNKQRELAHHITHMRTPLFYDRHVYFIHFPTYGLSQPVYINVVRDPIDRFVSAFYYDLNRCQVTQECHLKPGVNLNETVDACVQHSTAKRCRMPFAIIPYFCGHNYGCQQPGRWSLNKAKENVIRFYTVVGLSEDLSRFFQLLEKVFPAYCQQATRLFNRGGKQRQENAFSPNVNQLPSNKTVEILRRKMAFEYEFYEFVKQRFYKQYQYYMIRGRVNDIMTHL